MRKATRISALLLVIAVMVSCTSKENDVWPYGVKYELFVLAFADSNGDGKGDLKGVTAKLDYLQDLGVNGIWLMPIMPSPSYHKYDVSDYKDIDPDYGTLDDFKMLVDESHKRGIKIIIDMVLNHTAVSHPWFQSAMSDSLSPYRDYYLWNDLESIRDEISKKDTTLDSDNITQWHTVKNDTTKELYYGFFSSHMPDLNFDNEKVRNEFVNIGRFWLEEMHVDGFRFDAARHIYPEDRAWSNHEFWNWYRAELEKINPKVYLVGEVYSMNVNELSYYTKGLSSLFNFKMGKSIIHVLNNGSDYGLIDDYQRMMDSFHAVSPDYLDATILTNHDQNRVMSELANDPRKAKVAASILLTLPGVPFIYYGEELGMLGEKPDEHIREPFPWGDQYTTEWIAPLTVGPQPFKIQEHDDQSLYSHYKKMIAYRNKSEILTRGDITPVHRLPKEIVGMLRSYKKTSLLVFHNVSDQEVSIALEEDLSFYKIIELSTSDQVVLDGDILTMPAFSTVIIKK